VRRWTILSLLAVGLALAATGWRAAARSDAALACSRATAEQVAAPDNPFFGSSTGQERLKQVLCGPFAGPGSDAMAVTFTAGTCWSPQGWALYVDRGGAWTRVAMFSSWLSSPLVAVGSDLHEVDPVFQSFDPRCLPSGGDRWRLVHWNGTTLVAGRWHPVKTPVMFWSGRAPLTCEIRDDGSAPGSWAYCWRGAYGRARHVRLSSDGRVDTRHRQRLPSGLGGPTPPWGTTIRTARFRCTDLHAGMRCTVRKTGKGFLFDKRGRAHRVG
jgi:hypothetical protein